MTPSSQRTALRVLFIDDSSATRQLCAERFGKEPGLHVLGQLPDPAAALRRIHTESPDVVVIDIEMPRSGGIAIVQQIMRERPTPIVIFSGLQGRAAELGVQAMAAGAVATVRKPQTTLMSSLAGAAVTLLAAIRDAAQAKARLARMAAPPSRAMTAGELIRNKRAEDAEPQSPLAEIGGFMRSKQNADSILPTRPGQKAMPGGERLIAIGASTGGTQALEVILTRLPSQLPGIVIVQHMPEKFTSMFAARLNDLCKLEVREARNGDKVRPGLVLIAPGGRHMMVKRAGSGYHVEITDGPLVNRHKPSVDLMFRSVALAAGASAAGFILTGMGDDGARGLKEMSDAGAHTVAQDEFSCVVFGMPKMAIAMGGVDKIIPLDRIHTEIAAIN